MESIIHECKIDKTIDYGLRPLPPASNQCSLLCECRFLAYLQKELRLLVPKLVIWHAWCLCPGGPSDDPWPPGSTRKDTLRSRLGFVLIFGGIRDPMLKTFLGSLDKKRCILSCLLPARFSDDFLGVNLDVWDWKTKHLALEVLRKATFAEIGFLMIPGPIFHDVG